MNVKAQLARAQNTVGFSQLTWRDKTAREKHLAQFSWTHPHPVPRRPWNVLLYCSEAKGQLSSDCEREQEPSLKTEETHLQLYSLCFLVPHKPRTRHVLPWPHLITIRKPPVMWLIKAVFPSLLSHSKEQAFRG